MNNEESTSSTDVVVTRGVGGENRKIKLALLVASVGMIIFIVITLTFSFKEPIFSVLFPKPQSIAAPSSPTPEPEPSVVAPLTSSLESTPAASTLRKVDFTGSKRVFLTSTVYDGRLGGLSGADAKCQTRADSLKLGGSWKAWLSDSKTSASSRITHWSGPYKTMDGKEVAENWADLTDGVLKSPVSMDEFGYSASWNVWTNTNEKGEVASVDDCIGWSSNISYLGKVGSSSYTDSRWTSYSTSTCNYTRRLYCIEQ